MFDTPEITYCLNLLEAFAKLTISIHMLLQL